MDEREALADRATSASNMETVSKETALSLPGGSDEYDISSYKATVVRSLLRHALADVNWVVAEENGVFTRYDSGELPSADASIVGVCVSLPVGTFSIKGTSRSNNHHSSIVSTPEQVANAREAFNDD